MTKASSNLVASREGELLLGPLSYSASGDLGGQGFGGRSEMAQPQVQVPNWVKNWRRMRARSYDLAGKIEEHFWFHTNWMISATCKFAGHQVPVLVRQCLDQALKRICPSSALLVTCKGVASEDSQESPRSPPLFSEGVSKAFKEEAEVGDSDSTQSAEAPAPPPMPREVGTARAPMERVQQALEAPSFQQEPPREAPAVRPSQPEKAAPQAPTAPTTSRPKFQQPSPPPLPPPPATRSGYADPVRTRSGYADPLPAPTTCAGYADPVQTRSGNADPLPPPTAHAGYADPRRSRSGKTDHLPPPGAARSRSIDPAGQAAQAGVFDPAVIKQSEAKALIESPAAKKLCLEVLERLRSLRDSADRGEKQQFLKKGLRLMLHPDKAPTEEDKALRSDVFIWFNKFWVPRFKDYYLKPKAC